MKRWMVLITAAVLSVAATGAASAASSHKYRYHHWHYGMNYSHEYWPTSNPSYGPGTREFRRLQREGRCVIDEGYGRYSYCGGE